MKRKLRRTAMYLAIAVAVAGFILFNSINIKQKKFFS